MKERLVSSVAGLFKSSVSTGNIPRRSLYNFVMLVCGLTTSITWTCKMLVLNFPPKFPRRELSVFSFCKEWENDPGHVAFTQRLYNTPDTNSVDEIAKGNIVYDLMTGGINPDQVE